MQAVYKTLEKQHSPERRDIFIVTLAIASGTLSIVTFCVMYSRALYKLSEECYDRCRVGDGVL
jgi:hypothetical protein